MNTSSFDKMDNDKEEKDFEYDNNAGEELSVSDGCICDICSKQFANVKSLKNHIESTHSQTRYSCSVCGKLFKTKEGVKNHQRVHTGEKPFVCVHCGKSFSDDSSRIYHEKYQHLPEGNKIICPECGK